MLGAPPPVQGPPESAQRCMAKHAVPHCHRSTGPIWSFCRTVSFGVGDGDRGQQWTPCDQRYVEKPDEARSGCRHVRVWRDPPEQQWGPQNHQEDCTGHGRENHRHRGDPTASDQRHPARNDLSPWLDEPKGQQGGHLCQQAERQKIDPSPSGYVEVDQPLLSESAREPEDERDPPYSGWKGRQCRGVRAYPRPSWRS